MTRTETRLLVVDASVVQSAGDTEHPVSSACRRCLQDILRVCHRVAVTPSITEEWGRHMSRFSRKWRRSMVARRKVVEVVVPTRMPVDISGFVNPAREDIAKDVCYLAAALAADRVIVTRDDKLRSALGKRPDGRKVLKSIRWINPVTDDPQVLRAL